MDESSPGREVVGARSLEADWYANPNGDGLRYWDGRQWTEHTDAAVSGAPPKRRKEAIETLAATVNARERAVGDAAMQLELARRDYARRVGRAEKALAEAGKGKKLRSIGGLRRITLYEDRIKLPEGLKPLTPEVHATADQHEIKQVVQGSAFKANHFHLTIEGPGWASVVPFKLENSLSQPKDLHAFAGAVNAAARGVNAAGRQIQRRVVAARNALRTVQEDRATIHQAAARLVEIANATDDVHTRMSQLRAFGRKARKAGGELERADEAMRRWESMAEAHAKKVAESSRGTIASTDEANPDTQTSVAASPPTAEPETGLPDTAAVGAVRP